MSEIIIYKTTDGLSKVDVKLEDNNIWLTQSQMVELYQTSKSNISEHIKHIFEDGELQENSVVRNFRTTASDGKEYNVMHYSLEMVIAVGYRVKSKQGTQFRIWATNILKEYIEKGFAMDDERLKEAGSTHYWKELLDRIRDIRSSEKMIYRQVLDLYATSIDYDKSAPESLSFFKIVQNKLHYAAHGNTAAEAIFYRIDANKPFLGLKSMTGNLPTKKDAKIAKNFLDEKELKILNNLVSAYFDLAETYAMKREYLYMKDYIEHLDRILAANGDGVLKGSGKISHKQAMDKVDTEYKIYQEKTITDVEKAYLESIKKLEKDLTKKTKELE